MKWVQHDNITITINFNDIRNQNPMKSLSDSLLAVMVLKKLVYCPRIANYQRVGDIMIFQLTKVVLKFQFDGKF